MAKFQEAQEAYDKLAELHDAALVDKAALRELRPVAQKAYLELHCNSSTHLQTQNGGR